MAAPVVPSEPPPADPAEIEIARYDPVARAVHWLVAGLAVIVVSLGWAILGASRETESRDLLLLHRSVGLLILALMVFRAVWRLGHPPPPLGFPRIQALAAHADQFQN